MKVLDLFAGIGGFTIGLERAGFETAAFCEIDPYAQKVLRKNWPGVPIYDDVRTITAKRLASDGIGVDVITGGFPCQDISVSGNRAGIQGGTRSGLWSECARLLGELRPQYAIFENVTNLLNGERGAWFKRVLWDISQIGYDAEWHCIPACELGSRTITEINGSGCRSLTPAAQYGRNNTQLDIPIRPSGARAQMTLQQFCQDLGRRQQRTMQKRELILRNTIAIRQHYRRKRVGR